ncbi:MAG: alpha-L-rhamnosidase [Anaerolineae bacterium]|nr:alpha-L-rhamnosidase [Anaerolineae bacterium]
MRVIQEENPFPTVPMPAYPQTDFPARWVWHPASPKGEATVLAFRLPFSLESARKLRFHVSADQRYELFLDGQRLGRGPARGELAHWFFDTYEVNLAPGPHFFAAKVWWLPPGGAPMAQITSEPGFLLFVEGDLAKQLSTGSGAWEVMAIDAYSKEPFILSGVYRVVGWSFAFDGTRYPWNWHNDPSVPGPWVPAIGERIPIGGESNPYYDPEGLEARAHHLVPALLPAMLEERRQIGLVRHAERGSSAHFDAQVLPSKHDPELAQRCQALLREEGSLSLAPQECIRFIIDLENYYCAYPELITSGGAGAQITIAWAESLYESPNPSRNEKGNRDQIEQKYFFGPKDRFILDGGERRLYDTLWWRSGRYVEVIISVAKDPLTIERLAWRETRYPLEMESRWEASDPRLGEIIPLMHRSLQMCAHETYMDCPYYEQLMYVGDTRLEALVTYVTTFDERLPILANSMFDWSRAPDGFTKSRYPSAIPQVIPPFSLWWVGMVHDFFLWRDRPELVRRWLSGVDAVLRGFQHYLSSEGLLSAIKGWNYGDWVPAWKGGWPPEAKDGANALINLQYIYALDRAVELHTYFQEPAMAEHWRTISSQVRQAVIRTYWDEERGLLSDDPGHRFYSEHVQALAILTNLLQGEQRQRMIEGLLSAPDLARTTIYFSHYLFEALYAIGAIERLYERLGFWFELPQRGFKTTLEAPEPSRSDCHAWGSHPIYHYYASFLGARPAAPGFKAIRIRPLPGPLQWLRGSLPHPSGEMITFDLDFGSGEPQGKIKLPSSLHGTFVWGGKERPLKPGENVLK